MNEVIVVSACTHRDGFIDEYEVQLFAAGVPFHLDEFDDLPDGPNSVTMRVRLQFLRKMATRFIDYGILYATDAWDVLFFGTKQDLINKAPKSYLCAAERNCYPELDVRDRIPAVSPWCYANAGVLACPPRELLRWCDEVESGPDLDILDQAWINRRLAEQSPLVALDTRTELFYVVSEKFEDGSLQAKDGRPWNAKFGTAPNFLHFSGKCPSEKIREMLRP